jgi:hypothetical protein
MNRVYELTSIGWYYTETNFFGSPSRQRCFSVPTKVKRCAIRHNTRCISWDGHFAIALRSDRTPAVDHARLHRLEKELDELENDIRDERRRHNRRAEFDYEYNGEHDVLAAGLASAVGILALGLGLASSSTRK